MNKSGLLNVTPLDIIAGIIVIAGGVSIAFSYVNLGSFIASLGLLIESLKAMMRGGLK